MATVYHIGDTLIYTAAITPEDGSSRRDCERKAVTDILKEAVGNPSLTHDENGAPHIDAWYISISHSRQMAVVALDKHRRIGVDAEEWRPTLRRVAERFLSEAERQYITSDADLLRAWTIKEAVYKIAGMGAVDFRESIHISEDMASASALGHTYMITSLSHGSTLITLAVAHMSEDDDNAAV